MRNLQFDAPPKNDIISQIGRIRRQRIPGEMLWRAWIFTRLIVKKHLDLSCSGSQR